MKNKIFLRGRVSPWSYYNSLAYLQEELAKCDGGDITVYIASGGGDVFEGINMHNALRAYASANNAKVTTVAMSLVASIALFYFLAGDERHAYDNSSMMGHNSASFAWGDRHDMERQRNLLDKIDDIQAKKFDKLQGLGEEQIKLNMDKEMWYIGEDDLLSSKLVTKVLSTQDHVEEMPKEMTQSISNPKEVVEAHHKEYMADILKHDDKFDFDSAKKSVEACYGNCNLTGETQGNSERPSKDSVNLKNDKGELSMNEEELAKLQANYASSQSKVTELSAEKERLTAEVAAEKEKYEKEITALKETHKNELTAHKKVFGTVLASGKHFNLDQETLQANLDKATKELTANANYTDGFVAHTVNTLVLANIETDGAFVAGGGNDPQGNTETEGADAIANWKKNKQGAK